MNHATFRAILNDHREHVPLPDAQEHVLRLLGQCRSAAAGVHQTWCTACGHEQTRFNSCRNRHCPICHGADQADWVRKREEELLPVPYMHGVCTLPHELLPLAHRAPALVYGLLMRCASQSLADLCADPQHLGATIGQISVLHTWGSDLKEHPHVHLVVTGGGLSPDGTWISAKITKKKRKLFLVPFKCWRARFRGLMLAGLRAAFIDGAFDEDDGSPSPLWGDLRSFGRFLGRIGKKKWNIYLKKPFGGPRQVIRYLGRYTHRVALNLGRIIEYDGSTVTLQYTDYQNGGRKATRHFSGTEFIRAFARHILPAGFRRIRMSGLWAPRVRQQKLEEAKKALERLPPPPRHQRLTDKDDHNLAPLPPATPHACPQCGAIGSTVLIQFDRWNRTTRSWETIAPETANETVQRARLSQPVTPRDHPYDPEDLFAIDSA